MKKKAVLAILILAGAAAGIRITIKSERSRRREAEKMSGKFSALFHMMNQWVKVKQAGKNLSSYFLKNNYKKIAVYGMGYAGKALLEELRATEINVVYGIDRKAEDLHMDIHIVSPDAPFPEGADAVVVTAVDSFEEIEESLSKKTDCPIISLEEIVFEV